MKFKGEMLKGAKAYAAGKPASANPREAGSGRAREWDAGHRLTGETVRFHLACARGASRRVALAKRLFRETGDCSRALQAAAERDERDRHMRIVRRAMFRSK